MYDLLEMTLTLFGFTRFQEIIAVVCLVILLGNLLGGLLHSIMLAFGGPRPERKLTDRISFRIVLSSEVFLIIFAIYYHAILIGTVTFAHVVYWGFAMVAAPVLAVIGTQISYMVYAKQIEANKRAYRKWAAGRKAQKDMPPEDVEPAPAPARPAHRTFAPRAHP